jgi:hypothetical protein
LLKPYSLVPYCTSLASGGAATEVQEAAMPQSVLEWRRQCQATTNKKLRGRRECFNGGDAANESAKKEQRRHAI